MVVAKKVILHTKQGIKQQTCGIQKLKDVSQQAKQIACG